MASFLTSILGVVLLWGFVAWIATAFFAAHVANTKDRCGPCWFAWGILFGPLALLAAAGMAPLHYAIAHYDVGGGGPTAEVPYDGRRGRAAGQALASNFKKPGAAMAAAVIVGVVVLVYAANRFAGS